MGEDKSAGDIRSYLDGTFIKKFFSETSSDAPVIPFRPEMDPSDDVLLEPTPPNTGGVPSNISNFTTKAFNATKPDVDELPLSTVFAGNEEWTIRVQFNNYSLPNLFTVPANQIADLVINHNITDPQYLKGYVVIRSKRLGNIIQNNELNTEFVFRGDGSDVIKIDLKLNPKPGREVELPPEVWLSKLDFVVYDVEDIPTDKIHYKKIHFWHKPYHIMHTRKIPYSTADYNLDFASDQPVQNKDNKERALPTGMAIASVLEKVGLGEYVDEKNWDIGSSSIFFTAPSNYTAENIIQYFLRHHTSTDGDDPGMLYYNRGINKFQLLSLKTFFEKAGNTSGAPGEYQLEHFWVLPKDTGVDDLIGLQPGRAPNDERVAGYDRDIKLSAFSVISEESYTLSEMSGTDSMFALITRPVHTYDHDKKQFRMQLADNNIESVKDHFKQSYVNNLYPGEKGYPLFVLNPDKKTNRANHHAFIPFNNKSERSLLSFGRNVILRSAVFLNLAIEFVVPGSTHRHPGRFIGIEKHRSNTDNKYDYRLLGQWFVLSTTFVWRDSSLANYINAVKVHAFGDLKFNEDDIDTEGRS